MAERSAGIPLGPDSLTWRYFGDWRNLLMALWVGSMQNMHPVLGLAVAEHSRFFEDRWKRIFRSFYPILGVVYDGDRAHETAVKVRGYHHAIQGNDQSGRTYHAMSPDVFYWAHAVFFMAMIKFGDRFMGGVSEAARLRMFAEHVQWYQLYGLTMRAVPSSWEEFQEYWDRMCAEVLEDNQTTRDVLDLQGLPRPQFLVCVPSLLWRPLWRVCAPGIIWLATGFYDPVVRERLGMRWSPFDERLHKALGRVVHTVFSILPHDRRFHPRARAGWRRSRGADVPPVESPIRHH
ncbi:oxygenase MpaB family protein [Streptomyces sp. NPDC060022]|uniref:oxygenase MpaB family protein n=1 Tax=Streptomyces sp. NPDC060022 TaxID=3347039 RepID=UPI003688F921